MLSSGGLVIDTPSPDAFCPALEQTRQVVEARLGTVDFEGNWRATYVLVHRPRGDFVVLSLRDPDGVLRLTRDLPVQAGSCATTSQVIALVLERFFSSPDAPRNEGDEAKEPKTTTSANAKPGPIVASTPHDDRTNAVVATAQTKEENYSAKKEISFDAPRASHQTYATVEWSTTQHWLAPTLKLGFNFGIRNAFTTSVGFDVSDHERKLVTGTVSLRRWPVYFGMAHSFSLMNGLEVELAGGLFGLLEQGSSRGLLENGAKTRVVPGLFGSVSVYFLPKSSPISPFLGPLMGLTFEELSARFEIDKKEVFSPARWLFGANFGLRLRI